MQYLNYEIDTFGKNPHRKTYKRTQKSKRREKYVTREN